MAGTLVRTQERLFGCRNVWMQLVASSTGPRRERDRSVLRQGGRAGWVRGCVGGGANDMQSIRERSGELLRVGSGRL